MARIIDISQPFGTRTAVWPGDRTVDVEWTLRRDRGDSVNVAALTASVHAGTHVDGPFHFADDGERIGDVALDTYYGPAYVIDATGVDVIDWRIAGAIRDALPRRDEARGASAADTGKAPPQPGDSLPPLHGTRLLFRTRAHVAETEFPADFAAFDPAFARRLAEAGVRLVGTDAPSVDPVDSQTLDAHHAFGDRGVAILENVVLQHVEAGAYVLIALPLRLIEADSSPVRAVLLAAS